MGRTGRADEHHAAEAGSGRIPGEHLKLITLLNRFGFNPMSKREAMRLAGKLLDEGWDD
jgi:hypothetical protein